VRAGLKQGPDLAPNSGQDHAADSGVHTDPPGLTRDESRRSATLGSPRRSSLMPPSPSRPTRQQSAITADTYAPGASQRQSLNVNRSWAPASRRIADSAGCKVRARLFVLYKISRFCAGPTGIGDPRKRCTAGPAWMNATGSPGWLRDDRPRPS